MPHTRRAIGTATVTFALAALGLATLVWALFWLVRRLLRGRDFSPAQRAIPPVLALLVGVLLSVQTGAQTFRRYFVEWGPSEEAQLSFHVYDLELADLMARQSGPETVYLLPLDSAAGIVNPLLDTITFVYEGTASYDFLPDDEQTMLARLSDLTVDKQTARLLRWNVTKHTGADPKGVTSYYLEKWGQQVDTQSFAYFDIDTYELAPAAGAFLSGGADPG